MSTPEAISLTTFTLGLNPYVVIEAVDDTDSPVGFDLKVKAGQVGSQDQLVCLLLLVVETITGVDTDLYVQQVDTVRRAAGLGRLSDSFTDGGDAR